MLILIILLIRELLFSSLLRVSLANIRRSFLDKFSKLSSLMESFYSKFYFFQVYFVGEPGFEPGTSRSQTVRATNCATLRFEYYSRTQESQQNLIYIIFHTSKEFTFVSPFKSKAEPSQLPRSCLIIT